MSATRQAATSGGVPRQLADAGTIVKRVQDIKQRYSTHFEKIRLLDKYSRRVQQSWFPNSDVSITSVTKSTIRATEKTAIAMLSGGEPVFRVSRSAADATAAQGSTSAQPGQQGAGPPGTPQATAADGEKIARAIFHMIDGQSEINLLQEPVMRAIRQGEIIFQYGWLGAEDRGATGNPGNTGTPGLGNKSLAAGASAAPPTPLPHGSGAGGNPGANVPNAVPQAQGGGSGYVAPPKFPLFVKVHDRLKIFYELTPFGEVGELYHEYRTTASQAVQDFPEWADGLTRDPNDAVKIVDAWVGAYHSIIIEDAVVQPAADHGYGPHPPFVVERCAVEDVAQDAGDENSVAVLAGMPFCMDMMEAFKEASISTSLKRAILENSALGSWVYEQLPNTGATAFQHQQPGEHGINVKMGPGTVTTPPAGYKIVPAPVQPLPPAVASYLAEAEADMATLGFSGSLLSGETPGDPSGYSIEQVRQAAMARLSPYKQSIGRAFSRLWERLFVVLAQEWAPEWGSAIPMFGKDIAGSPFSIQVTEAMLVPPPEHVEVELIPMLPQNKIALRQSLGMQVQQGTKDVLTAMDEDGIADPQAEFENWLIHNLQMKDPQAQMSAVQAILQKRSGQPPAAPHGLVPTGNVVAQPPPGAKVVGPPPDPHPQLPQPPPGKPGPAPAPRPAGAPQGMPGSPNSPLPTVPAPNQGTPPTLRR